MIAYFLRRIFAGIVTLLLSSFLVYTSMYFLGPSYLWSCVRCDYPVMRHFLWSEDFETHKSWPDNYISWLFDSEDTTMWPTYDIEGNRLEGSRKGIDLTVGNFAFSGSGALTGDFGTSMAIEPGTPIAEFITPLVKTLLAPILGLIVALLLVVLAQRWRRPQPYRVSALPTASTLLDWWQLNSRSPLDVVITKRQWG